MQPFTSFVENNNQFKHTLRNDFFDELQPYKTRVQLPKQFKTVYKRPEIPQKIKNDHLFDQLISRFSAQSPIKRYDRHDFKKRLQNQDMPKVDIPNQLTVEMKKFQEKVEEAAKQKRAFEENEKKRLHNLYKRDLETNFGFFPVKHKSVNEDYLIFLKNDKMSKTAK